MAGLLVLLAHPDDEFFCGGLLAAVHSHGVPIHLVYWTHGQGGGPWWRRDFWRRLPRDWHPRVREARGVARLLEATSLTFLGSVDPVPNPELRAPEDETAAVVEKLERVRVLYSPELVVTHGSDGDYGHPAHRQLHEIARAFVTETPDLPMVSFNADFGDPPLSRFVNVHDPADFVLDGGPWLKLKRSIVLTHRSQKGVLEMLSGTGGSLQALLEATRCEGYHCWSDKAAALEKLAQWAGAEPSGA